MKAKNTSTKIPELIALALIALATLLIILMCAVLQYLPPHLPIDQLP